MQSAEGLSLLRWAERKQRQAARWLKELRDVRALAVDRDEKYRMEIERLRAELARRDADAAELRRQLQAALERRQTIEEKANG